MVPKQERWPEPVLPPAKPPTRPVPPPVNTEDDEINVPEFPQGIEIVQIEGE